MALTQNLAATVSDQTIGLGYNAASQIATRSSSNDIYAMRQQYNANRGYSVNGLNQYLTAGTAIPTYDARGNLTGQGTSSFTYSSENLLKSATLSSGASTLRYDPAMRLAQTSGSATTRFLYDGTDLVAEYDGAATVVLRRYVHGPGADEPLVWYEGSGTSDRRWLHADERGSIIAVTNGSGASIGTNAYDEWGNPQSGNLGRFGYTGQTWLPEIGLWYYKARMYNPRLGRFMQTDPIGYGDGMNLYAYVGGDPVNFSDPTGLHCYNEHLATDEENANNDCGRVDGIEVTGQGHNHGPGPGPGPSGGGGGIGGAPSDGPPDCGPGDSSDLRNFLWGVGDVALLGFGDNLRDAFDIDPVDTDSNAYFAGEIAGSVAMLATGVGGGLRAAGAAGKGLEFSHFIPARMGGARSLWNGNFVSTKTHALSDPFRYRFMPKSWKAANPMPNRASQMWTRTPNAVKGTAAGAGAAGTGLAGSGC